MLVLGFDAHAAVPLSKATVFGGGVANCIFFFQMRHPTSAAVLLHPAAHHSLECCGTGGTCARRSTVMLFGSTVTHCYRYSTRSNTLTPSSDSPLSALACFS